MIFLTDKINYVLHLFRKINLGSYSFSRFTNFDSYKKKTFCRNPESFITFIYLHPTALPTDTALAQLKSKIQELQTSPGFFFFLTNEYGASSIFIIIIVVVFCLVSEAYFPDLSVVQNTYSIYWSKIIIFGSSLLFWLGYTSAASS